MVALCFVTTPTCFLPEAEFEPGPEEYHALPPDNNRIASVGMKYRVNAPLSSKE